MANKKCLGCGAYKPLIGGYCSECKSLKAYEVNERTNRILDSMVYDDPECESSTNTYSSYCDALKKQYDRRKHEEDRVPTKEEAYEEVFKAIVTQNGIPEAAVKKFKPQLNHLIKRYLFQLALGNYGITDKSHFVKNYAGTVVAVAGRWVVYQYMIEESDGVEVELRPEIKEFISTIEASIKADMLTQNNETEGENTNDNN